MYKKIFLTFTLFWICLHSGFAQDHHFGLGGRVKFEKENRLGVRFPVGFAYEFEKTPLDIFVEIVPVFDIIPDTEFNMNGGIGIRYFF